MATSWHRLAEHHRRTHRGGPLHRPQPPPRLATSSRLRFVSARLANGSQKLGQLDIAEPTVTEHTDLYRLLETLITHLHGSQK
ncbi:hypothetical protein AB0424_28775 [Streptomyces sp. NPDC051180]|uniref:hypothetical protein n=1 Tax=unclassified Streptomyces TaxID=2593676 RepID=UPI003450C72A